MDGACSDSEVVWPAVNEAFGMVPLEAQLQGLAIISGNEGGISGVVDNHVTGELVEPRNPEAMAQAINQLLDDPGRLQRYRSQAPIYVKSRHSIDMVTTLLRDKLADLLEDS